MRVTPYFPEVYLCINIWPSEKTLTVTDKSKKKTVSTELKVRFGIILSNNCYHI